MKKLAIGIALISSLQLAAQEATPNNDASFELGHGLNFSFANGAYKFKLSGMLQPSLAFDKMKDQDANYYLNAKRTYFNLSGQALKEKVGFLVQMDFSLSNPLLDAWIAYHPWENVTFTFGQKQTIANNREMMIMEDKLQFPDRGLLSQTFSNTGREFGLYFDGKFGTTFGIEPQLAVTSGDGRNSFGADSRDVDLGGMKYGGRIDLYPLGFFSPGNDDLIADLQHEQSLRFVLGFAASYNDGASNSAGEGHGDFYLYNGNGDVQLPDYRQVYTDLLMKYKGFSLLGEYVVATATSLEGTYIDQSASEALVPTEISEYLSLGSGYNAQLGYVTKSGYALDFRYDDITPEFGDNANSIVSPTSAWTAGFSKYFKGNALKLQLALSSIDYSDNSNMMVGKLVMQVVF